jgi:hypothetical protein
MWSGRPTRAQQPQTGAQQVEFAEAHVQDAQRVLSFVEATREGLAHMPGEVLVRFVPGSEPWPQATALRVLRADVGDQNSRWIGDALHIQTPDIVDAERAAELLRRQLEVLYAVDRRCRGGGRGE